VKKETLRVVEFPNPSDAWGFDQQGNKVKEKVFTKAPVSQYWTQRLNIIGLVLMVSTGVLVLILLNETHLFENLWNGLIGFILGMLGVK